MEREFLWWSVLHSQVGIPGEVAIYVLETLWGGKPRIFGPGRRSTPLQVARFNRHIIAGALRAMTASGLELDPKSVVGVPILTEGLAFPTPFFQALEDVGLGSGGGVFTIWVKRRPLHRVLRPEENFLPFTARVLHHNEDDVTLRRLRQLEGNSGTLMFSDIGATGATIAAVVPHVVALANGRVRNAIFASPCTSVYAIRSFVQAAVESGLEPENLVIVASEGIFELGTDGTALWLGPEAITSLGNRKLSELIYPRGCCQIGAGGLAATCHGAYLEELEKDEEEWGPVRNFKSLETAMREARLQWPRDFGSPF